MSQRCNTCSNPHIEEINQLIQRGVAYARIASDFNLNSKSVERHAKQHLQPIIDRANKEAESKIVNKILQLREEVNYAPLEKVKLLQNKLLIELDNVSETSERISIIKEFRGWVQEEAKLCGLYQQDRENEQKIQRVIKSIQDLLADHPHLDKDEVIQIVSGKTGVSVETINQNLEGIH